MVQIKMFDQNSSKLTAFHIPHTKSKKATKQITIINTSTPETPFQNNNDGCVQTSVGSDLTESSLDCKPSAAEKGIAHDFDLYSLKDIVFNESENAIVAIGEDKNITNPKLDRFMIISNILSSNLIVLGLVI